MERRSESTFPWLVAAGALATAWIVTKRMQRPYYPDVARNAGLELLSRRHRVLAIGPDLDALERYSGGTLRQLVRNGSAVTVAVLSRESGEYPSMPEANLVQFDLPDGPIRPGPELERAVNEIWHQTRPDLILAFDPKGPTSFATDPEHLALGAAVLARARRAVSNGERLYLYATRKPNVLVDREGFYRLL